MLFPQLWNINLIQILLDLDQIDIYMLHRDDPAVPVEVLSYRVKPLTRCELEAEAGAWLLLLQQKVREIADAEVAAIYKKEEIAKAKEVEKALEDGLGVRDLRCELLELVEGRGSGQRQVGGSAKCYLGYRPRCSADRSGTLIHERVTKHRKAPLVPQGDLLDDALPVGRSYEANAILEVLDRHRIGVREVGDRRNLR